MRNYVKQTSAVRTSRRTRKQCGHKEINREKCNKKFRRRKKKWEKYELQNDFLNKPIFIGVVRCGMETMIELKSNGKKIKIYSIYRESFIGPVGSIRQETNTDEYTAHKLCNMHRTFRTVEIFILIVASFDSSSLFRFFFFFSCIQLDAQTSSTNYIETRVAHIYFFFASAPP